MTTTRGARDYVGIDISHLLHPATAHFEHTKTGGIVFVEGDGIVLKDSEGREYLDCMSGMWCVNVGHGRQEIVAAVASQMAKLPFATSWWGFSNPASLELSATLAGLLGPLGLTRYHYTSGGSETNDVVFKIARSYWRAKGKQDKIKIISRLLGYHGTTFGALSATGISSFWSTFGPLVPGFLHIPPPHCYRCPWDKSYPGCELECATALEEAIEREGADTVAAFIAEPVMGAGGVIVPPPEYWPKVREICTKHDVLLVADEVICGFGRTGKMFAVQHWGVKPDIMCLAKGITSAYVPLGAVAMTEEVFQGLSAPGSTFMHGYTYNGHPVCCAAAVANIKIIVEEGLAANAAAVGAYALERFGELLDLPLVGNVRGLGMAWAIELVADKATKRPTDPAKQIGTTVKTAMLERGMMGRVSGDVITFAPPLITTRADVDRMVDILRSILVELPR